MLDQAHRVLELESGAVPGPQQSSQVHSVRQLGRLQLQRRPHAPTDVKLSGIGWKTSRLDEQPIATPDSNWAQLREMPNVRTSDATSQWAIAGDYQEQASQRTL
ncbi:unnamed protein product [Phytophthora fragariaefolia]|uniref:Unnamed protein product n=1 Tax=Phytophthora fragariaefolia TaxID=1490495 RepID=A0A9W6XCT0_9STRA|nr:unnamed protein product [Phytophthora fragariaefolia]